MKLLVTGSAGFIGSHFVQTALASKSIDHIISIDKLTYAGHVSNLPKDERHTFFRGDIADRGLVESVLHNNQIDTIVHFAAESHVDRSIDAPSEFIRTNIVGTFELLEAARKCGTKCFLQVSTDEVFGSLGANDSKFTEAHPYAPNSPYAASKASADHLVRAYHRTYGLRTLTTNCSNNFGPRQFPEKLIPLVILNALEGKSIPVYGDGKNIRDWLFVEDHCNALLRVLESGMAGESYCIGGQSELTNLEIVQSICTILDKLFPGIVPHEKLIRFVEDRPGHDRRYAIDSSKICALGWKPKNVTQHDLENTVRWYVDNREWCNEIKSYQRERLGLGKR